MYRQKKDVNRTESDCPLELACVQLNSPGKNGSRAVSLIQGFLVKYLTLLVIVNHLKLKGKLPPKISSTGLILHHHYKIEDNLLALESVFPCSHIPSRTLLRSYSSDTI